MKEEQLRAINEGNLTLGNITLNVAVLNDGTRVISQSAIFKAFGRKRRGRSKNEIRVPNMPPFMDAGNIQPYVDEELKSVLNKINYVTKNGSSTIEGYDATIIPLLCKMYLDARDAGVLKPSQAQLARESELLLFSLSKIGIIALVDEATGYQYDREKDELQRILKAYISEALLPWQKRFPDIFYKELFRLNGWDYTVRGIKNRPGIIGKWTNTLVYEQLPPGVLAELKRKTPISNLGNKTAKYHQFLTLDIGEPNLTNQIQQVVTLFQLSDTMEQMWTQFEKLNLRKQGQLDIPFAFDNSGHTKL